ncbi:FAD-binding domain-containing protein [Roridomyces roridus]|uniref:ferric-chelate reductase (NADPH) n=1 Tax=Roridomyces roridus TaxID=1738132 RepID=A0AAD7FGD1_9AGAR|nr:FAD-binding domain-containing protein [Roridomyces roridus]
MGIIWLAGPITWHSSRVAEGYDYDAMTEHERWLISARWHDWYTADWDYGQTTVEFFCAAIGCCLLFNVYARLRARSSGTNRVIDKLTAVLRYTVARQWQFRLGTTYYAPPLAAIIAVCGLWIFVLTLTLAARPFYWPNPAMGESPPLATRSGWISIGIMPFMIAFATKVNWVSVLTGTSHEKLQVVPSVECAHHVCVLFPTPSHITSLTHTFPFIVTNIRMGMMQAMWDPHASSFYWTGVAALIPQTFLVALSWGVIRNRYYEIFKKDYFWATLAIWGSTWLIRTGRTLWNTRLGLRTVVSSVGSTSDLVKLRIATPASFKWVPGQHVFVRVFGLGVHAFSSHPFTINSVHAVGEGKEAEVELILRVHGGITRALAKKVEDGKREWTTRVAIDGPYGGVHAPLERYEKVYLLAGGTGATFVLPILTDLAAKMKAGGKDVVCKRVEVVIAVPDSDAYTWMHPSIAAATSKLPDTDTALGVRVYHTRAYSGKGDNKSDIEADLESVSSESELTGRPDLFGIVREAHESAEKVAIIACGPDSFLYDVRNAVADAQLVIVDGFGKCKDLFLHTETYR